jgi:arginyl-tRNA synthetase
VVEAVGELAPHRVCTYLYELAQEFSRFYENNKVIGGENEALRRKLVEKYAEVLIVGLGLLGIEVPEKM